MRKKRKISTIKKPLALLSASIINNSSQENISTGESMTIANSNNSNLDFKENEKSSNKEWEQLIKDLPLIGESYPEDFSLDKERASAWGE